MTSRGAALAGVALATLVASPAFAHEVLHTIERGRAVAVKAFFSDGEPLAYSEYVVFSPADAKIPYQKGRTDRAGYVAFVPDLPGPWHVKVTDPSGHGLELDVPVQAPGQGVSSQPGGLATWAFVVRPLLGVLLIAGLFVALVMIYRKRKS